MADRRERLPLSPLGREIAIMALTLLLSLALLLPVQGRIRAYSARAEAERSLTLALTAAAERIKADPAAALSPGLHTETIQADTLVITASIQREQRPGGLYDTITLTATGPEGLTRTLTTGIYRPEEVSP